MGGNAGLRADFDIISGTWLTGGAQPSDVAILNWELVIPQDREAALVLYCFGMKT